MGKAAAAAAPDATGLRLALVAARYNEALVEQLVAGALAAWQAAGGAAEGLRIERVPGAFELPLAAQALARSGSYDAVVALGCVIRGDTAHFDFVAGECARGLQQVMLATGVPVAFGVLTTENVAQARERAAPGAQNKGAEALHTALAMAQLLRRV
ncbi:MAG: 6,7-dimethyl-8-ribityllumazine synthase [Gammaproteobacteria bacterium]|nr:6,7-dimethyl-8-ribityllumazine synthase [Gammaproteobacteria bacterium]MDE2251020.1 6,7-dimethyl-8-ribityllumazine synthase [Gammaproteobacteria bacterium]